MNNEEAIKELIELKDYNNKFAIIGSKRKEALNIAIEILEHYESDLKMAFYWGYADALSDQHKR